MSYFSYKDGVLHAEGLSVADLAAEYGTPFYLYSANAIKQNYESFDSALKQTGIDYNIFYALKANSNQAVVSLLGTCGSGADVVSVGEIKRALLAGIPASKIVFSGVGKSDAEIAQALDSDILQFNVESESELALLNRIAESKGKTAKVALRINPDVDAMTHAKISTGKSENKFGVPLSEAPRIYNDANNMSAITPCAIAMHIGSQLLDLDPYAKAWRRMAELANTLIANGIAISRLDVGGGLGVAYDNAPTIPIDDYANLVASTFKGLPVSFMFEPGRSLVANSGILVSRVLHTKQGAERRFIICDSAMNDFIRPTLYEGFHRIDSVLENKSKRTLTDVVGPVCESGDFFAKGRDLPSSLDSGDLIYISDVGAYGAVMSGTYNTRPLIAEVMVQGDKHALIRPAVSEDDIIKQDKVPTFF